jgi:group II intron reverse transcriptase/maturase
VWRRRSSNIIVEGSLEPIFKPDSYGYRPNKSALGAIEVTRKRCWEYDWVLEFDICGLFDNIDHTLLLRAVRKHVKCTWALLYIERWLKAPMELEDGTLVERTKGTPQGGVVSPVLANLFMHCTFDVRMAQECPDLPWCRYADDGLVHCRTEAEARTIKAKLASRLAECHLEMHPEKTNIVYCKDGNRRGEYPNTKFDFLGYCFRARAAKNRKGQLFSSFSPQVSAISLKAMRQQIRELNLTQAHANTSGGHCPETQPNPPRMVELLWALLSDSDEPNVAVRKCHIGCVDDAKIQALCGTENTGESIDWFRCHQATQTVRTLASKQRWCVCLMGAV